MKPPRITLVVVLLCIAAAVRGGPAQEPAKAELHKDMTLAEVRALYPGMRHDVWLCFLCTKADVPLYLVGGQGHGGRPRAVDMFLALEGPDVANMGRESMAAVKKGMAKDEVRLLLGEPGKTGSVGTGDKKVEFWYYGNWVLHFRDGIVEKEGNKPKLPAVSEERQVERAAQSVMLVWEYVRKEYDFVALVNTVAPKANLGEIWRTREQVFQFWRGKLSRWGEPADDLLDELNSLDQKVKSPYLPEPVSVTLTAMFPPSTIGQRDAIRGGRVQNGMSRLAVLASVGRPRDINRSVFEGLGSHEQWVYGGIDGTYLYFEDDRLTSWQD